ncbi:MAG: hypothetical protein C4531_08165 [Desulfurivibrio sp.]|nr:MAG: hypothetical protein C4531_08165 [Desulfurivibrio sp.]
MAKESDSKDPFDFELPEGLADDLGGDWESAFQAEDFMLTPEDEAEVFFEQEAKPGADDIDLASLLESEASQPKNVSPASPVTAAEQIRPEQSPQISWLASLLPAALPAIPARAADWFQARPRYQKILFPSLAALAILSLCAVLFFRSTSQQLAEKQPSAPAAPLATSVPAVQPQPGAIAPAPQPTLRQTEPPAPAPMKNRKKWPMHSFFIAVQPKDNSEGFLVRIDLNLILLLEPGTNIPEDKRAFVRDTIFQFFANRPPEELRRYSLARGEMIRNLESWLHKEWPQNPIASIMFDRYQILN